MVYLASSDVGFGVLPTAAIPFKALISLKICQNKMRQIQKGERKATNTFLKQQVIPINTE